MVSLQHVRKSYAGKLALDSTSLSVAHGCSLALIGPSGCGKSTLLRILVGLVAPDTGTVCVGDVPLSPATLPSLRLRMGYVLQDGGLFPHLSAEENLRLVPRQLAWAPSKIATRVAELAALVRLPREMLARFPIELSGGQRQRVALMRALMLDPDVLLLDEPLGALDPVVRAELQDELLRIIGAVEKTVIVVTHDMAEAARLGDEIAIMRGGVIVQRGTLDALLSTPNDPFVTQFIEAQSRSPLVARVRRAH